MRNPIRSSLLVGTGLLASFVLAGVEAQAAAFLLQEQSARGAGRAFAGEAAIAEDASTVFYNPAGMTQLAGPQVVAGAVVLKPEAKLANGGSVANGTAVGGRPADQGFDAQPISHLHAAAPLADDLWLGFALTVPFGLKNKYKPDYWGRYDSIESRIVTIDAAPSVAYAVTPRLSLGGGIDIQYIEAKLVQAIPNPGGLGDPTQDGKLTIKGKDITAGYNLGALYKPSDDLRIGATYRAAISHAVRGTSTQDFSGTTRQGVTANIDLPDIFSLALAYDATSALTLLAQGNFYTWGRYDQVHFDFADGSRSTLEEQFRNAFGLSLGAQYAAGRGWTLRGGASLDQTPTRDGFRSTSMPDADRIWLAVGASYEIGAGFALDLSYAHMLANEEPINRTNRFPAISTTVQTRGTTETGSDVIGVSLRVAF